jgi:hypothetical protein
VFSQHEYSVNTSTILYERLPLSDLRRPSCSTLFVRTAMQPHFGCPLRGLAVLSLLTPTTYVASRRVREVLHASDDCLGTLIIVSAAFSLFHSISCVFSLLRTNCSAIDNCYERKNYVYTPINVCLCKGPKCRHNRSNNTNSARNSICQTPPSHPQLRHLMANARHDRLNAMSAFGLLAC